MIYSLTYSFTKRRVNQVIGSLINFVYRPPDSRQDWIDIYENQFRSAVNQLPEIFILEDFNITFTSNNTCCNLKWSTFYSKYGLTQLITERTRVTHNTSSIIDHIYTTYPDPVFDIVVPKVAII